MSDQETIFTPKFLRAFPIFAVISLIIICIVCYAKLIASSAEFQAELSERKSPREIHSFMSESLCHKERAEDQIRASGKFTELDSIRIDSSCKSEAEGEKLLDAIADLEK